MKKLILLGALSVLFCSAPGNAARRPGKEAADMDKAFGGKEAREKDELETAIELSREQARKDEIMRNNRIIVSPRDEEAEFKYYKELKAAEAEAPPAAAEWAEISPEHVEQLKKVMDTQVEKCEAANAKMERLQAQMTQASDRWEQAKKDALRAKAEVDPKILDAANAVSGQLEQAYAEWLPLHAQAKAAKEAWAQASAQEKAQKAQAAQTDDPEEAAVDSEEDCMPMEAARKALARERAAPPAAGGVLPLPAGGVLPLPAAAPQQRDDAYAGFLRMLEAQPAQEAVPSAPPEAALAEEARHEEWLTERRREMGVERWREMDEERRAMVSELMVTSAQFDRAYEEYKEWTERLNALYERRPKWKDGDEEVMRARAQLYAADKRMTEVHKEYEAAKAQSAELAERETARAVKEIDAAVLRRAVREAAEPVPSAPPLEEGE